MTNNGVLRGPARRGFTSRTTRRIVSTIRHAHRWLRPSGDAVATSKPLAHRPPLIHQDPRESAWKPVSNHAIEQTQLRRQHHLLATQARVQRDRVAKLRESPSVGQWHAVRAHRVTAFIEGLCQTRHTSTKKEFCTKHNVVEARMRQLCSASSNLYRRALEAMDANTREMHDSTTASLQTEDPFTRRSAIE